MAHDGKNGASVQQGRSDGHGKGLSNMRAMVLDGWKTQGRERRDQLFELAWGRLVREQSMTRASHRYAFSEQYERLCDDVALEQVAGARFDSS